MLLGVGCVRGNQACDRNTTAASPALPAQIQRGAWTASIIPGRHENAMQSAALSHSTRGVFSAPSCAARETLFFWSSLADHWT